MSRNCFNTDFTQCLSKTSDFGDFPDFFQSDASFNPVKCFFENDHCVYQEFVSRIDNEIVFFLLPAGCLLEMNIFSNFGLETTDVVFACNKDNCNKAPSACNDLKCCDLNQQVLELSEDLVFPNNLPCISSDFTQISVDDPCFDINSTCSIQDFELVDEFEVCGTSGESVRQKSSFILLILISANAGLILVVFVLYKMLAVVEISEDTDDSDDSDETDIDIGQTEYAEESEDDLENYSPSLKVSFDSIFGEKKESLVSADSKDTPSIVSSYF